MARESCAGALFAIGLRVVLADWELRPKMFPVKEKAAAADPPREKEEVEVVVVVVVSWAIFVEYET